MIELVSSFKTKMLYLNTIPKSMSHIQYRYFNGNNSCRDHDLNPNFQLCALVCYPCKRSEVQVPVQEADF